LTANKATALVALVGTTTETNVDSAEATFPDPAQDPWMQTFAGVNTFEEWLVRIGAPADEVAAMVSLAESEGTLPDPAQFN
jgi:hypothetical protein